MDAMTWLWVGFMSLLAYWLGHDVGVRKSCKVFAALLIQFGLWDAYRAASERHERGQG